MKATREELFAVYSVENQDSEAIAKAFTPFAEGNGMMMRGEPVELHNMAILARTHLLLRRLGEELTTREIPHTYVGRKTALTNSEEFRRFHAFLKLIENPYDSFSFLLIRELIGLSPQEYRETRVRAAREGMSHFQAWQNYELGDPTWQGFFDAGWDLSEASEILAENLKGQIPTESIDNFVADYLDIHNGSTISDYLDWLATWDIQEEIKDEPEGITLSTIHAAKGLEWPVVIVAGCNEGLLPSKQAIANGEIEEEVRLAYVAMTRARDQLILAVRPERKEFPDGRVIESPVSRFVGWAVGG
jgi:DNA helicase-2/ATP-dependent DNA helicase PcrA